ncbi:hypothetical protein [Streptomyces longispororuber]|uniref:hypothetical protein n=1 Tax=Streptomyces longispororuber TaxID=68230 RepID=UPI0036FBDDA1
MAVSLSKPTDAEERLIADYVQRRGLGDVIARQQLQDGRRWAAKLSADQRANAYASPVVRRFSPMTTFVLEEAMRERGEL